VLRGRSPRRRSTCLPAVLGLEGDVLQHPAVGIRDVALEDDEFDEFVGERQGQLALGASAGAAEVEAHGGVGALAPVGAGVAGLGGTRAVAD
jgi:hypothetical protein